MDARPADHPARFERALLALDGLSLGDAFGERFFGRDSVAEAAIAARTVPSPPPSFGFHWWAPAGLLTSSHSLPKPPEKSGMPAPWLARKSSKKSTSFETITRRSAVESCCEAVMNEFVVVCSASPPWPNAADTSHGHRARKAASPSR